MNASTLFRSFVLSSLSAFLTAQHMIDKFVAPSPTSIGQTPISFRSSLSKMHCIPFLVYEINLWICPLYKWLNYCSVPCVAPFEDAEHFKSPILSASWIFLAVCEGLKTSLDFNEGTWTCTFREPCVNATGQRCASCLAADCAIGGTSKVLSLYVAQLILAP